MQISVVVPLYNEEESLPELAAWIAEVMQRIRPLMDEGALSTGAGRRQLLTEMRRLNDAIGM